MSFNAAPPPTVDDAPAHPAEDSAPAPLMSGGDLDAAAPADPKGGRAAGDPVELHSSALDLARSAAIAEAGTADHVGDLRSVVAEDDVAVSVLFGARQPGYAGWHWSVTLAVLGPGLATVSEVVLLPGEGSLLAPAWVPWDQRIRPGDVGVGDLLPPIENDPRLVPAYLQSDDPAVEAVARELGIGRVHALSREGRVDFAERLHDGTFGPTGEVAVAAPDHCFSCAFYLPLAGSLGQLLGACGNEYSPADGRVVDAEFGCGAHSETLIEMPARSATTLAVIDELSLEVHRRPEPAGVAGTDADQVADVEAADTHAVPAHLDELDVDGPGSPAELEADLEVVDLEPADVEVADVEPADVELADLEPADVEVADVEVADVEPADAEVADVEPADAEVADVEVADVQVADVEHGDLAVEGAARVDAGVTDAAGDQPGPDPTPRD